MMDSTTTGEAHTYDPDLLVQFHEIEEARDRIRSAIIMTPCSPSKLLSDRLGCKVFLKLENLQITGSFKERGACNRLMTLSPADRARGVIASSAGNHAQALAYHGSRLGIDTKIVMPEGTPLIKVTRTKSFGAQVVLHGANYDEAYQHARELCEREGRVFAHPFNDRAVIAGQGTIGLELLEQNPYIDVVLVAIGGGGLISGVAAALKETNPKIRIIGVETAALPSMKLALAAGQPVTAPEAATLADGIAVRRVGETTLANVARYVDDIVTVSEEQIANAILTLLEQEKTVAEGAGAAPVAALLEGLVPNIKGKRVCPIICGGNIDMNIISRIIERGLVAAGRLYQLEVTLQDVPGALATLLTHVGKLRANVLEVVHNRTFGSTLRFGTTQVELTMETRGQPHIEQIRTQLQELGYQLEVKG
jgi:threonine dehydratase